MPNSLLGKTIILTGTTTSPSVINLIEQHSGEAKVFPLIETVEADCAEDANRLSKLNDYQWLIFTSQNAVTFFIRKCERQCIDVHKLGLRIAAVGEKTAQLLRNFGFTIDFMPSIYSADVFVREFLLELDERALFLRGSLAKSTIRDHIGADEWTVYVTQPCTTHIDAFKQCLANAKQPIIVFASPSAVEAYAQQIAPTYGFVACASIGHVTTAALANYDVVPVVQPKIYTMQAVIEQLILEEQKHD